MAENWGTPEEALARKKKQMDETYAAFKQAEAAAREGEKAGYEDVKILEERFNLALEEYKQSRREYLPFYIEDGIKPPPVARAAYSDRMAWVMANMANMAYIRFDSSHRPNELDWEDRQKKERTRLEFCLRSGQYGHQKSGNKPSEAGLSFELLEIFDTSEEYQNGTKQTETQAFLVKSDTFAVLSFRGTEPTHLADVLINLKAVRRKTKDGEVHIGFLEAYNEVKDKIHKALPKIGKLPLYVTGHSLGAALATVAVQDLDQDPNYRDQIAACYTFGSPRVGDRSYEEKIKVPMYRIAHSTDVVTLIPLFLGIYAHAGDPRYLSRTDKGRILYKGIPVLRRTWESILEMLDALVHFRFPLIVWIDAHSMAHYIYKLKIVAKARSPKS